MLDLLSFLLSLAISKTKSRRKKSEKHFCQRTIFYDTGDDFKLLKIKKVNGYNQTHDSV